jgi:hypothetical protein
MKVLNLKIPAVVALALSAATSAATAMPVVPLVGGGPNVVLVDCAYGWYRGPDGQCYPFGTGPRHHRGGGYYGGGGYDGRRDWHRGDEYRRRYRPYPYGEQQQYPSYGEPQYNQYNE